MRADLGAAVRQAAFLAVLAVAPALGAWKWKTPPAVPVASADGMIAPAEAAHLGERALWVDARRRDEFDRGHVPRAFLLNEDEWDALFPEVLQAWRPGQRVIVYCDGGACQASKQVAARLRDGGVSPVVVLRGGWPEWVKQMGTSAK